MMKIIAPALILLFFTPAKPEKAIAIGGTGADSAKVIHVFVALCDNRYQGIVPVPAAIGNGQDADRNLYWGCGFGIRTYFKKSAEWKLLSSRKKTGLIRERLLFKHQTKNYYLVADAYDGKEIRTCTEHFLRSAGGSRRDTLHHAGQVIRCGAASQLLAYIGHDGLMDFQLSESFANTDGKKRDVIILACYSKHFFSPHLEKANVNPLVWTSGLMCPEAYTIHDALYGYVRGENNEAIRSRAAHAYSTYQKCSERAARNLLVTGW